MIPGRGYFTTTEVESGFRYGSSLCCYVWFLAHIDRRTDTLNAMAFYSLTVAAQLALYNGIVLSWREKVCFVGYAGILTLALPRVCREQSDWVPGRPGVFATYMVYAQGDGLCLHDSTSFL